MEFWVGGAYRGYKMNSDAVAMGQMMLFDAPDKEWDAKMLIGYGYQCMGEYEKAIPVLEDVVYKLPTEHGGPVHNLATCYAKAGKYKEASELYDRLINSGKYPTLETECRFELAEMLRDKMNDPDRAIALVLETRNLPQNRERLSQVRYQIGTFLLHSGCQ